MDCDPGGTATASMTPNCGSLCVLEGGQNYFGLKRESGGTALVAPCFVAGGGTLALLKNKSGLHASPGGTMLTAP